MLPAVLFDLDGTLFDHDTAAGNAVLGWVAARLPLPDGDRTPVIERWRSLERRCFAEYTAGHVGYQEHRRTRMREFLAHLDLPPRTSDDLDALFEDYLRRYQAGWRAFDDAAPTLQLLAQAGVQLGVLTNGQRDQQLRKLEVTELRSFFAVVAAVPDLLAPKPAPAAFLTACARLGRPPEEVIYVGDDRHVDALAATTAGLRGIWLNRSGEPAEGLTVPEIGDLIELGDLVPIPRGGSADLSVGAPTVPS